MNKKEYWIHIFSLALYITIKFNQIVRYRTVAILHSGCLDSENILSTIDPPPGVPGVSNNCIFFSTNESVFLLR